MSSPPLWLALEPRLEFTQFLLSHPGRGTLLKARLAPTPAAPGALSQLLESLSSWHGLPLFAVLDADAEEVQSSPERWARLLGEAAESPNISIQWSAPARGRLSRERFFEMGDFTSARRMLVRSASGQRW